MDKLQLRVLFRQFLFRLFDMEVLSAKSEGDAYKLLGQFAALLIFVSAILSWVAIVFDGPWAAGLLRLVVTMIMQHFLIATTMLVVGLFAVLSWDATFPDRRDVLVLAPLPVRARTMFLAKVAAVAASLGLTVLLLHSLMGVVWPLVIAARAAPATVPKMTPDPTPAPVAARDLEAVMDRDLQQVLTVGELAPQTGLGMTIGVWKQGERRVFAYGAAKPDSLFEIGSITKTFTGLILARMAERGEVRLDEPVRELLPPGTLAGPEKGVQEITLVDLATHHSGLPMMPDNFHPADPSDPYADFTVQRLYSFIRRHGVAKPADAGYSYSNLGVGLLAQALAVRAGRTYSDHLREEITGPLGMTDTVLKLSDEQERRFLQGHDAAHRPVHHWFVPGLAGAGSIRSTAGDMMTYLEANLHPEKHPTLSDAFGLSHQVREGVDAIRGIALVWVRDENGTWSHGGGTPGFTSYAFFDPRGDYAVVVLISSGVNLLLEPDLIGEHIRQRLSGEPAISLDSVVVPASSGLRGVLRSFGAYWFTMLAAGAFIYGSVLSVQGLTALVLPRRLFLRFSGYLQLAGVGLIVFVYFVQPGFYAIDDFVAVHLIQWLPSYWFLALYQQLNGSMHPALEPLARRAWIGLVGVLCAAPVIYALCYWRLLRGIVEDPDIAPGAPRWSRLIRNRPPRLGSLPQNAIVQFTVRTVARSRQHRLILGFYLGIGLAFTSLLLKSAGATAASNSGREESMLLWSASFIVIALAAIGARVAFAMPLDLRANWIFRVVGTRGGLESLTAVRRALLLVSVTPVWLVTACVCLGIWPSRQNAGHLAVLAFVGLIVADLCLLGFRKIPFTCSWLPGKSYFHMAFLGALGLLIVGREGATRERLALQETGATAVMLALLFVVSLCVRWTSVIHAKRNKEELRFEEEEPPVVMTLGL